MHRAAHDQRCWMYCICKAYSLGLPAFNRNVIVVPQGEFSNALHIPRKRTPVTHSLGIAEHSDFRISRKKFSCVNFAWPTRPWRGVGIGYMRCPWYAFKTTGNLLPVGLTKIGRNKTHLTGLFVHTLVHKLPPFWCYSFPL